MTARVSMGPIPIHVPVSLDLSAPIVKQTSMNVLPIRVVIAELAWMASTVFRVSVSQVSRVRCVKL